MKVLLALHHPRLVDSGAPGATVRLGDALERAGCDVRYAFYDEVMPGHVVGPTTQLCYPWALTRFVWLLRNRWCPDVVDVSTGDGWVMSQLRRLWGGHFPVIVARSHGLEHLHYLRFAQQASSNGTSLSWRHRAYHGGFRLWEVARSLRTADHAVMLNHGDRDFAERVLRVPAARLSVLPLPLTDRFFAPRAGRPRRDHHLRLIFLGTWTPLKGVAVLNAALAGLVHRGVELRVTLAGTGTGPDEILPSLADTLRPMTTVMPRVANSEVPALLDDHDVFVLPSFSEGANVALSEAMARGMAVVTTSVGAAPDHIRDGVDGLLVPPGDAERLSDAVLQLHADDALRRRLSASAAESARRHLPDAVAAQTIALYQMLVRARRQEPVLA